MYLIFIVSFFNAGVLYFIAPWAFTEEGALEGGFFSGIFTDFTSTWFQEIGELIASTTVISVFAPLIEAFCFYLLRLVGRCSDQKTCFPCDRSKTNATSI